MKKTFQLIPSRNSRGLKDINYANTKAVDVFNWENNQCTYEGEWKVVKADDIMWYLRCDDFVCEVTLRCHKGQWYINAGRRPVYGHINLFKEVLERVKNTTPTSMVLSAAIQQAGPESWRIREAEEFADSPIYFTADDIWNSPHKITLPNIPKSIKAANPKLSESRIKHKARRSYMFYCRNRNIEVQPYELDHFVRMGLLHMDEDSFETTINNRGLAVKEFKDVEVYLGKDGAIRGGNDDFKLNISFANKYHQQQLAKLLGI